jgi:lipoprotein Spr
MIVCVSCASTGPGSNYRTRNGPRYPDLNNRPDTVASLDTTRADGALWESIEKRLGAPYRYGRSGEDAFDCSGFVMVVMREAFDLALPRSTVDQYAEGRPVARSNLRDGDLVFFVTRGNRVSHVGVYVGDDRFAHASTKRGVIVSSLDEGYYAKRYLGARRVLE